MSRPLLERRSPLGISYALLILTVFFFLIPSAFRAARQSLGTKENDVKDWLPSDFPETAELEWFADHFVGESFVVATWPGCSSGDKRLRLLENKLVHESESYDPSVEAPAELKETYRRARQVGKELQLMQTGNDYRNWGGRDEKWLCSAQGQWYFITPNGRLYRWDSSNAAPAAAIRSIRRSMDRFELDGQFVTAFGDEPISKVANPFFNDPSLLCAPLFETVQTGDSIVAELATEKGPLWPVDLTEEDRRGIVARRLAMSRLTGTLFAPAVPSGFAWTTEALRNALPQNQRESLPETFDAAVQSKLDEIIEERFAGSLGQLQTASTDAQAETWYAVYDAAEVEPPPRMTCVLLTLTEIGKNNLPFAIGRGVLGGPRGRLLQLAEESGVQPAPAAVDGAATVRSRAGHSEFWIAAAASRRPPGRQHGNRRRRLGDAGSPGRLQRPAGYRALVLLFPQSENHGDDIRRGRLISDVEHGDGLVDRWHRRRDLDEHAVVGLRAGPVRRNPRG